MKKSARIVRFALSLAIALGASWASTARGAEQAAEFVESLRSSGYHDYAVAYLESIRESRLVSAEYKETIGYELGRTLLEGLELVPSKSARFKQIDRAEKEFKDFIAANGSHELADAALSKLGLVQIVRARAALSEAKSKPSQRDALRKTAMTHFDAAQAVFVDREKKLLERIAALMKTPKNDAREKLNDTLNSRIWINNLDMAQIAKFKAEAYSDDAKKFKELMKAAADEYGKIFEDQAARGFGYQARLEQARCVFAMDDPRTALEFFRALLELKGFDTPVIRMKTYGYIGSIECYLHDKVKEYDKALEYCTHWYSQLANNPQDAKEEHWLGFQYVMALTNSKVAETLKKSKKPADVARRKELLDEALRLAMFVSRNPSSYRDDARDLATKLRGESGELAGEPKSFIEAYERATEERATAASKKQLLGLLEDRIEHEKDPPEGMDELKKKLAETREAIPALEAEATRFSLLGLRLATASSEIDKVNDLRANLARSFLEEKAYMESATMGGFLARRYPQTRFGPFGAKIALISWNHLQGAQKDEAGKSFVAAQIADIANYISKTWKDDHATTDDANLLLAKIAVGTGKMEEAIAYLNKISPDSSRLGLAKADVGRTLWKQFAEKKKELKSAPIPPEVAAMADNARTLLADSLVSMKKQGGATIATLLAQLTLVEGRLDEGDADQAITLLEEDNYGPLWLIEKQHPATQPPSVEKPEALAAGVYLTAMRAYIGGAGDAKNQEKAEQMIAKLEPIIGSAKLGAAYSMLARQMADDFDAAETIEKKRAIAAGMSKFLVKMRDGPSGNSFATLAYVLSKFNTVATTLYDGDGKISDDTKEYYKEVVATGKKILDLVGSGKTKASPAHMMQVRSMLATATAQLGDFDGAIKAYEEVLKQSSGQLAIQLDAAKLYLNEGAGDPTNYRLAIYGGELKDPRSQKSVIWGFKTIAARIQSNEKFRNQYHDANYHLIKAEYEYALAKGGAVKKNFLSAAKRQITLTNEGFPDMGKDQPGKWDVKYDKLLKLINKELGE